jgi:hypothetical protein
MEKLFSRYTIILWGSILLEISISNKIPAEGNIRENANLDEILGLGIEVLEFWRELGNINKSVTGHDGVWGNVQTKVRL